MQKASIRWFVLLLLISLLMSLACQGVAAVPTDTPLPPPPLDTATATVEPTATPRPTATPDAAATQEFEARQAVLQAYADKGYIQTTAGDFEDLVDFHQEWAQLHWYQWWPIHSSPSQYGDMVFRGHFAWKSALSTSDISGCGIIFGLHDNKDHYAVFIDKSRIAFFMNRGGNVYQVGKTSGSGRLSLQEPTEADVAVIIRGTTSYVLVNDVVTRYTLSADQSSSGDFALSLLSGTNHDYGTSCDITDAYLWLPAQ